MNMKALIYVLFIFTSSYSHSNPKIIDDLINTYTQEKLTEFQKSAIDDIGGLPYFLLYEGKEGSKEKMNVDIYLSATQKSFWLNLKAQNKTGNPHWFCPYSESLISPWSNPDVLRDLIYNVIESTPENFRDGGEFKDLTSIIRYGLQTKYPCSEPIPKGERIPGFVYKWGNQHENFIR